MRSIIKDAPAGSKVFAVICDSKGELLTVDGVIRSAQNGRLEVERKLTHYRTDVYTYPISSWMQEVFPDRKRAVAARKLAEVEQGSASARSEFTTRTGRFLPDSPGSHLAAYMAKENLSRTDAEFLLRLPRGGLDRLLYGVWPVDEELRERLAAVTHTDAGTWREREENYREERLKLITDMAKGVVSNG